MRWTDTARAHTTIVAGLAAGDTFTFEAWVRLRDLSADGILMTTTGGADTGPQVQVMTGGALRLYKRSTGEDFVTTGYPLSDGDWHHVVIAHAVGATNVYVDGVDKVGTLTAKVFTDNYDTFQVGAAAAATSSDLCHVAWYTTTKTEAWALARYRLGRSVVPEDFTLEDDWSDVVHGVYVKGANAVASGMVNLAGADFERGAITAYIERPRADTAAEKRRAGRAYIRRHGKVRGGTFRTMASGAWRSGQTLTITDAAAGLDAEQFVIRQVEGTLEPGSVPSYDIEFGAVRRSLLRMLPPRRRRR
jgi:hypothetical protein